MAISIDCERSSGCYHYMSIWSYCLKLKESQGETDQSVIRSDEGFPPGKGTRPEDIISMTQEFEEFKKINTLEQVIGQQKIHVGAAF